MSSLFGLVRKVNCRAVSFGVRSFSSANDDLVLMQPWSENNSAITQITMNNPKKRNCLSSDMMTELTNKIKSANQLEKTQVIIINGNGPIFSAGHDLRELLAASEQNDTNKLESVFHLCTELMTTVRQSQIPIICMTHGWASAAGLQLAAASDMIVSTNSCQFSTPGVSIGLFCSTPAVELSRCVGRKIAMQMLLTGEPINAQRAYEVGLLNQVIETDDIDDLRSATEEMAMKIVSKSKPVIALGKSGFYKQIELNLNEAHETAGSCMVNNLYIQDSKEGINSFIQKRHPEWQHK